MNLAMFRSQQVHSNNEHKWLPARAGVTALNLLTNAWALLMQVVSAVKKGKCYLSVVMQIVFISWNPRKGLGEPPGVPGSTLRTTAAEDSESINPLSNLLRAHVKKI